MIICICKEITDKDIHDAIKAGCESFEKYLAFRNLSLDCRTCFEEAKLIFLNRVEALI